MARRVITLMGAPIVTEDLEALEAITPGYLVEQPAAGVSKQTITDLAAPATVALERDELGKGIDGSVGSETADYAIGDTVKVGHFAPGMRFYGFVASGQTLLQDALLDSAGDGTLQAMAGLRPMARALEAVTSSDPGDTRIRVEVI